MRRSRGQCAEQVVALDRMLVASRSASAWSRHLVLATSRCIAVTSFSAIAATRGCPRCRMLPPSRHGMSTARGSGYTGSPTLTSTWHGISAVASR